jgi:excisionase family DNA binding protein
MRLEIADDTLDALQEALSPSLERLVLKHLERRQKLLVNIGQAADQLSCSEASVRTLIRDGRLEAIPWGRSYRIRWEILEGYVASLVAPYGWPVRTIPRERGYRHEARPAPVGKRALPATRPPQRPRARRSSNAVPGDGMVSESEFRRITELPSAETRAIFEELGAQDDPDHQERVASRTALVEWLGAHPDWGRATAWGGGPRS